MDQDQPELSRLMGLLFVAASIIFNISVSGVYLAVKFDSTMLLQVSGVIVILLILPFSITLLGFVREKMEPKRILTVVIILFYLLLELLFDYILMIPFRDILALHVFYIIVLYAAAGNMIGNSFWIDKKLGFVVLATFMVLIGCLIYLYAV